MRQWDCPYDDTDEDCYKCSKHGFKFDCSGCKDCEEYINSLTKGKKT